MRGKNDGKNYSMPGKGGERSIMKEDLARRSHQIHWPGEFRPEDASLFSHNELHIEAPAEKIWRHLVDVERWPSWYPNSRNIRLLDDAVKLGAEVRWRWTTYGFAMESRVDEYVPTHRLAWYGYSPGFAPVFYHAWLLQPQGNGVHVVTELAGAGTVASEIRQADEGVMHRGHDLWLATLKWVSEGP
ncbi:MAG: SRPBCC family protein [Steroidobacteraceae bacterium]